MSLKKPAPQNRAGFRTMIWARRLTQTGFFLFFLYLFLQTDSRFDPNSDISHPGGPVTFFFLADPLVLVATLLAGHRIPILLWYSLITLVVTLVLGRWFCGWFCPFGALHNLFSSLRRGKFKIRSQEETFSKWQKSKYYILVVLLFAAAGGTNLVGWLDPFSFFFRSLATSVFPALHQGVKAFFTWIYLSDPGIGPLRLTVITEPIYEFLRNHIFPAQQSHYSGVILIGTLFLVAAGMNLIRNRFWCRFLCPLGALLGWTGKNPLWRLHTDPSTCTNCRLCLLDCQGAADPHGERIWKPSECFFCYNCQGACPSRSISFSIATPGKEDS